MSQSSCWLDLLGVSSLNSLSPLQSSKAGPFHATSLQTEPIFKFFQPNLPFSFNFFIIILSIRKLQMKYRDFHVPRSDITVVFA